ncbi:MAG TPA: hypothetical protein VJV75_00595, partial [Candidatus Polarisedimenticolia bacterium]|nr:hypothetical protein [Candidatus Polarisedimenticolia bacterium]
MASIRFLLPCVVLLALGETAGAAPAPATPADRDSGSPSFSERVAAEDAVLRLLAGHAGVAPEDFRTRVPRDVVESRVRRTLALSEALAAFWSTPITREMLDAEVRRMTRDSVMPARLRERFAALGDDPALIAEVIARPALAERLARNFFASDRRIHAGAWREAEQLRRDLAEGRIDPRSPRPGREEIAIDATAAVPGLPAPVTEETDRLLVEVPLESTRDGGRAARYSIAKRTWDDWWADEGARFTAETLSARAAVAGAAGSTGAPRSPSATELARLEAAASCTPDTWSVLHGGAPDALRDSRAVWTGSLVLIWGGQRQNGTGWRYDPALDYWAPMRATGSPAFTSQASAVWTGTTMIVWGGATNSAVPVASGAIYDPLADGWTATSTAGAPAARSGHTAVWTGSRMIVWGGFAAPSMAESATGGVYDPALDQWTATPMSGAPAPRSGHTAVWTGGTMIVWGGCAAGPGCYGDGAAYDPQFDTWSPIPVTVTSPLGRGRHTAVWTGSRMIVWGGRGSLGTLFDTGGIYNPGSGWTPTSMLNAPVARQDQTGIWTGSRMIVWGGRSASVNPENSGGVYDPASDTWSATTITNVPQGRAAHVAVWAGTRMIVWGGVVGQMQVPINSGGRYDPVTNSWTPTNRGYQGAFGPGNAFSAWTGNQLLMWGGGSASGGLYDPATDTWTPTTSPWAPLGGQSVVWTGKKLVNWGGWYTQCCQCPPGGTGPYQVYTNGSTSYDPLINSWSVSPSSGPAPEVRAYQTAVWDGKEMIVWGGYRMLPCNGPTLFPNGFRYNPETGVYTPLPTTGAPPLGFATHNPAGFLTDDGVLFWSGQMGPYIYHRDTDSWTHGDSTGAPNVTYMQFAGGQLVGLSANPGFPDGGRYDPVADAWYPISESSLSPVCGPGATASSGTEIFWWGGGGGQNCNFNTDLGFHYDPV